MPSGALEAIQKAPFAKAPVIAAIKEKISIGKYYYNKLNGNKDIQILPPYKKDLKNIYWVVGIVIKNKKKKAIDIIKAEGKASTSFLQRKLQIGYNRAARIMETMEKEGIVGEANHVGKREIL